MVHVACEKTGIAVLSTIKNNASRNQIFAMKTFKSYFSALGLVFLNGLVFFLKEL